MHFLKTLFWVVLAVAVVLFSTANWTPTTINLWGGLQADVKLPVLIIAAFLLGFVPTYAYFRTRIWSLRRRIEAHDRNAAMAAVAPVPTMQPAEPQHSRSLTDAPHPTASDIGPSV